MITASVDVSISDSKLEDSRGSWHNGRVTKLKAANGDISVPARPGYEPGSRRVDPGPLCPSPDR